MSVVTPARWVESGARLGLAIKGIVYLAVGVGAVRFALGETTRSPGHREALRNLRDDLPFGALLLWIAAIGLACYALWRVVDMLLDPERRGGLSRAGSAIAALTHGALAVAAGRIALREPVQGEGAARGWTAQLLAEPWGAALVGAIGAAILAYAVSEVLRAARRELPERAGRAPRSALAALGLLGRGARGLVLGLIGAFLIAAAVRIDPSRTRGLGGALVELARRPSGPPILIAVAIGLCAYGLTLVALARRRRLRA